MVKKILLGASLVVLFLIALNFFVPAATQAQSVPSVPVGWGWSSNIGWIKLTGYGFNINTTTGTTTGYGWSPSIGWIDFSSARYFPATGELKGFARALTATTPQAGGWDGNISLYPASGSSYGLKTVGNQLAGYAWGSDVVGWTYFNFPAPSAFTCPSGQHEEPVGSHNCVDDDTSTLCGDGSTPVNGVCPANTCTTGTNTGSCTCGAGGVWNCPASCTPNWVCGAWSPAVCTSGATQTRTCSDQNNCPNSVNPFPTTNICPVNPTGPVLQAVSGHDLTVISDQSSAPVVSRPQAQVKNVGDADATNLTISISPSLMTDASPDIPLCALTINPNVVPTFVSCSNVSLTALPQGSTAYFSVKIPKFNQNISKNGKYTVTVSSDEGTTAKVFFYYQVSGTNPL